MGILNCEIVIRQHRTEDLPQLWRCSRLECARMKRSATCPSSRRCTCSLNSDLSDIGGIYITPGGNFWIATPKTNSQKWLASWAFSLKTTRKESCDECP
ncbi:hypothetical protein L917_19423 [Phytophthora nicotianae]|uniref:N-acetyltransferase domain-containing protein n=2 Tax=Phytophthora nicotianae TaxID=4792 RepID=V9E1U7_PHYNI|nr:hypothetical protein F443_20241 [Phytophthora nicotianae P1569]ETK73383.1 hypothetical protein L915_19687 [Phytophthora nicotianae]ETL80053.1 hypothetical protein L917_19423 [Phytophthora nicotianae]ETM33297.1 hypothetical protein L914_19458 [Phytophthora nicotianae]